MMDGLAATKDTTTDENVKVVYTQVMCDKRRNLRSTTPQLYPHFTKDYFGPDSNRSLYMVDRPHIWESNLGLADNQGQSPGKVGEGLAQSPQSYESRVSKK